MKIDKEYPATHSMSTAWYVADEEGNVAIMDYNSNGPVPWETEQTCIESLIYGHCENDDTNDYFLINLADDQIDDLMENPHQPEEEDLWFDCIFEIDLEQEQEFLELAKNPDIQIELCISKKRGLYSVDCYDCTEEHDKKFIAIESSTLKTMIDRGMIKQIFKAKNFFINDVWKDDKLHFEHQFTSAPYYIYKQPYWNELLAERLNIPLNPVKLNQFPIALRHRVPQVPIKFRECKQFQIAEWVPSCFNSSEEIAINGFVYQPIVLTNGTKAYVYTSQRGISFFDYCSEKSKYDCKECTHSCYTAHGNEYSKKPTVIFVFHPFGDYDYSMSVRSDVIIRHSIRIPLLYKIPYKHLKDYWVSKDVAMKSVTEDMLIDFFQKNYQHFEDMVIRFNPRVLILEEKTKTLLSQQYVINERHIIINNNLFPYYVADEIETYREEITQLTLLPYRGIEMPYIISVEEMEQYKKKYNVSD